MPMVYNEDTGTLEFVSDGVYSGPASQGNSIQGNFGDSPEMALRAKGYLPYSGWDGSQVDWQYMQGAGGQQFANELDYLKWLYGDGGTLTDYNGEAYYQTPNGADAYLPGRAPLVNNSPDSTLGQMVKMGLIGFGAAGLGGFIPGAEGIFGAAGAGGETAALADAAWGVNPASAGEFSLAGGTAGNLAGTGGLSSAAGGVTGLTPAGAGVTGLTGSGAAGSLLTPAMAVSMGLPASAAMGGAGATAAQVMGGAASAPWGVNPTSTAGRILDGSANTSDYLSAAGTLGSTALGLAGANAQTNSMNDIANRMLDEGKWARDAFKGTFSPDYSMANQPDFMNALNIGADAAARATSAKVGNPVDNPGAYAEMQKYISGSLALPQLNTTRSQLINAGGMGFDQAGQAQIGAAQSQGGMYNALGYGLGQLTQPDDPFKNIMKNMSGNGLLNVNNWRFL